MAAFGTETRNKKQETRNKKQETRNKKQKTRNKKQKTRNKELKVLIHLSLFVFIFKIFSLARVAELVDAADSKSAVRKNVLVRFQSRAPA